MATLLFTAIGTALGGPIGGAIGALVGQQVDSAIIGGGNREGPRLKELSTTTSTYGAAVPRHFGRMRVPGSIIWATDLVEHRQRQGGGKGRPSVTTYSYTASFAVALASRPIMRVGRIWADGNLLRGVAGDLKTGGTMRLHRGWPDQPADPLIAAVEGAAHCPAFRGLAYVVFENLELGDFFNRIPALTFEVIADEDPLTLDLLIDDVVADTDAAVTLADIAGFSAEGPLIDSLRVLESVMPMDCDAAGERLVIERERLQAAPIVLSEPAISVDDSDFGGPAGHSRSRASALPAPPEILRYYDIERDYQPGVQRAVGRPARGQPRSIELPAALTADTARALAQRVARRADWSRDRLSWRTAALDPAVVPGAIVVVPGHAGKWRVSEWEWRASGVELVLTRVIPSGAEYAPVSAVDPGRANPPLDLPPSPTVLHAFEVPWDGTGSADVARPVAAVSAAGASWSGAALFVDHGDGELQPLGPSGRTRSVVGTAQGALAPASPLLFDRTSRVTVTLIDPAMALVDATGRQLAIGANRALLGGEIIQFARAVPLGGGTWELSTLLRGRGGTENAVGLHVPGESFVLLDSAPVALDPGLVAAIPGSAIVAVGRGDADPVASPIVLQGAALKPLFPVHPRVEMLPDGGIALSWTRRARGAWDWPDGVETPLHEQAELYQVTYGPLAAPIAVWQVATSALTVSGTLRAQLAASLPGGAFAVRQQGSYALSAALLLATLS